MYIDEVFDKIIRFSLIKEQYHRKIPQNIIILQKLLGDIFMKVPIFQTSKAQLIYSSQLMLLFIRDLSLGSYSPFPSTLNSMRIVCLLLVLASVLFLGCTETSSFYDIPAYYGHFSLNFFQPSRLRTGKLTLFEYHFALDASYDNMTIFFAQEREHCIYIFNASSGEIKKFAGNCGIAGNIIGSLQSAEFDGVSSIAYFKPPSDHLISKMAQQQVYLVANDSCALEEEGCLLSDPLPSILNISNIRIDPFVSLFENEQEEAQYLFVADTNNHCIKMISIATQEISVIAGECGSNGFMDGPLGYNRLSYPRNLGVSREGTLFFFDSGSEYIRMVSKGVVYTLLLGACREVKEARKISGQLLRSVLCYENWTEGPTDASGHSFDPSILNICSLHSSQCANSAAVSTHY